METETKTTLTQACEDKLAREIAAIMKCRAAGKKTAGYMCHAFPPAVLAGLGLLPVRMLCGASSAAESAGEQIVRADVCPLVKSMLGNVSEMSGLHGEIDLWIGVATCDQMRRALEALSENLKREVHPVQLPATRTEESAEYYASQIKRMVGDIEKRHGIKFDGEKALEWQKERARAAEVIRKAVRSGGISPTDVHALFSLFTAAQPAGLTEFLENAIAESAPFEATRKIIVTGSPVAREDDDIFRMLESRGAAVIPLNCTGLNSVDDERVPENGGDLIEKLALDAFHKPACARNRPNADVFKRIQNELKESEASGVIVKCLKFCDNWYSERERLRENLGVPVLVFDSAYSEGERERILGRIEAFLETIE
ncbi:MAG: 2-hydroxyacyl-CoA dehydratase subunit D [Planctomycetota bacterium]|jgi:benzoyl-CoA reductase/2-hydroxyglutaryl-CoA dehydratase subunit BcrC/BadD/HgdB